MKAAPFSTPVCALLLVLALWQPLSLYLVALAVFGLPHVVWEMTFLRRLYGGRWPDVWWRGLMAVLLLQALLRCAFWQDRVPAEVVVAGDLLTLMLLLLLVAAAPAGTRWPARAMGLAAGLVVGAMLVWGDGMWVLLLLAMAHNFTPVAFAWDMARRNVGATADAAWLTGLFLLPLLVALMGCVLPLEALTPPAAVTGFAPLLDGQLPADWSNRRALWSGLALAQCFHYYAVIRLLPAVDQAARGRPLFTPLTRALALAAAALLLAYFLADYGHARKLYGVAAGVHAWLEWPLLIMALLGWAPDYSPKRAM